MHDFFNLYWGRVSQPKQARLLGRGTLDELTKMAQVFIDTQDAHWQEETSGFFALRGQHVLDDPYVALPDLGYSGPGAWDEDSAGPFVVVPAVYL